MEESRLKPMTEGYDQTLFLQIYKDTEQLRRKLAYGIDSRRFGVDYNEVLSWFDVKFIHAFNKYFGHKKPNLLKAYIIQSLQFFKNRVLRAAYTQKSQLNNTIDITELNKLHEPIVEWELDEKDFYLQLVMEFMKENLTQQAFRVLEVELTPPLYILERLETDTTKIPSNLIADYLGFGIGKEATKLVNSCRREIKAVTELAQEHFTVQAPVGI